MAPESRPGVSDIRDYLEEHKAGGFLALLVSAVLTHIFASELYSFFAGSEEFSPKLLGLGFFFAVLSVVIFKNWRRPWVWLGLSGFTLLQLLSLSVHHQSWVIGVLSACLLFAAARVSVYAPSEPASTRQHQLLNEVVAVDFARVNALILFLSKPAPGIADLIAALPHDATIENAGTFQSLQSVNWYMPLMAIHAHITRPDLGGHAAPTFEVIIIPSADLPGPRGKGSWVDVDVFCALVRRLVRNYRIELVVLPGHEEGVQWEDIASLSTAVNAAKTHLQSRGIEPLVIDITGGKSTCSAVGAALFLEAGEAFQYVSTTDYAVRMYELRPTARVAPLSE